MNSNNVKFLPKNDSTSCGKVRKFILFMGSQPPPQKNRALPPENSKTMSPLLFSSSTPP